MKTKQIFWGVFFLVIGILLMIDNFSSSGLELTGIYQYWPIILVLIGITIMVKDPMVKAAISGVNGLVLAFVLYSLVICPTWFFNGHKDIKWHHNTTVQKMEETDSTITDLFVKIGAGAGSFAVNGGCEDLYQFDGKGDFSFNKSREDNQLRLDIDMEDVNIDLSEKDRGQNYFNLFLNNKPAYKFDIGIGAASANLNLKELLISDFKLATGASAIDLALGYPAKDSYDAKIEMGVGTVRVTVPKDLGVSVKFDLPLSAKKLDGFNKITDDKYETENFSQSGKKLYIKVDGGLASFKIDRI